MLKNWRFSEGEGEKRHRDAREFEAYLIVCLTKLLFFSPATNQLINIFSYLQEVLLTSSEFKSSGESFVVLNQQREVVHFANMSPSKQEEAIFKGLQQVATICQVENCREDCEALVHCEALEIEEIKIKQPRIKKEVKMLDLGISRKEKLGSALKKIGKKPKTQAEMEIFVKTRMAAYAEQSEKVKKQKAFVYVALLPLKKDFPLILSPQHLCEAIFNSKKDITVKYYIGKGLRDGLNDYHQSSPELSSLAKAMDSGERRLLQIKTFECDTIEEAEKLEAKLLVSKL